MTIQKTGFLKQLSNGCKVYTQKVGTNAVTEVLNKDGMHTASRIKSFNRYSCGNKKVVEQTKFTRKLNNGIDTIEKEVTHRVYDNNNKLLGTRTLFSFNTSETDNTYAGLLKLKPLEKIIKAGKNTIKTTLNSIDGIRIRKDYFNEQNTLFRRIWFNKKGLPAFDSAKNKKGLQYASLFYASSNISFPTAQSGHTQSDGKSSKAVPGAIPLSESPTSGS